MTAGRLPQTKQTQSGAQMPYPVAEKTGVRMESGYPGVPPGAWVFHITFDFIGKIVLMLRMKWKDSRTVSEASFTDPPTHDNSFQSHVLRTAT